MIIKRLSASFGRLSNEVLILKDGLNIIHAPNESGKSTWCAFIKAMLYGIRTSDRDKAGYLAPKTRYRPWSGAPMEGEMDIEADGVAVTLQRTSAGRLPMKNFSAVLTGTGVPYPDLYPETAGETLTGASEEVFERSAFISQAGVKVSQTPELEKRITSLVVTGDENVSYSETDERLRSWQRKRRYNKTGAIPSLEDKLASIADKLSKIETGLEEAAEMRLEAERLKRRQEQLTEELRQFDRYESSRNIKRAREEYERVKDGYDRIYKELTKKGRAPSEGELAAIRGELKALQSLGALLQSEQKRMSEEKAVFEKLLDQKEASVFSQRDASRDVNEAEMLESDICKYSFRSAAAVIILILTAAFIILAVLLPSYRLYFAVLTLAGALLLILRLLRYRNLRWKLDRLLSCCDVASAGALKQKHQEYTGLLEELSEAESSLKSAEKSVFSTAESCRSIRSGLADKLKGAGLNNEPDIAERELSRIEMLMEKLADSKAEVIAAESVLSTLKKADISASGEESNIPEPARCRQEVSSELEIIMSRLEDITNRYNMALGEIRALGDPVILGSEKISAEEELGIQTAQYEAISLAINTLKEANLELQSRFSPLLSNTAARILARLTAGRYEKLAFDKTLEASAQTKDEAVSRSVLSLSTGTADQIYLALRLAVCKLVLPETCPLILDDTLCNFDDTRAYLALDCLKELSSSRQIMLFTCHLREAEYFKESGGVNIISL